MAELLPVLMFLALALLVFSSYPIAFILGGIALLFGLVGWAFGVFQLIEFFNFIARIWFVAENLVIIAVPCFIFMGVMLERSEIAKDLLETLQILLRRVPGGMALSVTVMSTIIASITGIIGASVVMMTLIALPTMLRYGYSTPLVTGTLAASSTLGILIPPSILLVFMVELLSISEGVIFAAALFPGLLLSLLYLGFILAFSAFVPGVAPKLGRAFGPQSWRDLLILALKGFVPPVLLLTMVLGSIFAGITTVTESSAVGAFGAILLAAGKRRLNLDVLNQTLQRSALMIGMVFFLVIGATCFSYIFRVLGGDDVILGVIDYVGFDSWGTLLLAMATVFLMGFFFDVLEILLVVVPVFAPIIENLDFGDYIAQGDVLYWFAILVAVNLQTSFLTPPMGLALFYVKGVAPPTVKMQQIYVGIIPFVLLQLVCVALIMAFPNIAMWFPQQIFD